MARPCYIDPIRRGAGGRARTADPDRKGVNPAPRSLYWACPGFRKSAREGSEPRGRGLGDPGLASTASIAASGSAEGIEV